MFFCLVFTSTSGQHKFTPDFTSERGKKVSRGPVHRARNNTFGEKKIIIHKHEETISHRLQMRGSDVGGFQFAMEDRDWNAPDPA